VARFSFARPAVHIDGAGANSAEMTTGIVANRFRRRMAWIVLVLSVLAGAFCFSGYVMAGSFLAAGGAPRLRVVATAYLIGVGVCLLVALTAVVVLFRSRTRGGPGLD
jgi:hypothetical protein